MWPTSCSAEWRPVRRSSERLFTGPAELAVQPGGDGIATGLLRRWLFLAGYRQPAATAGFVAATAPGDRPWAWPQSSSFARRGLLDELLRNIALLPSGVGDLFLPIAYLAPLDCVADRWRSCRGWSFAARGGNAWKRWSRTCPSPWNCWPRSAKRGSVSTPRCRAVLDSVREDRPLAREFRTLSVRPLGGQNAGRVLSAIGPPLGDLVRDDSRFGAGSGRTVGHRHCPGPSPPGRRSAGPPPRAGQRLCHGAAGQTDVSPGDLLHAGHLRLDARDRSLSSFSRLPTLFCT